MVNMVNMVRKHMLWPHIEPCHLKRSLTASVDLREYNLWSQGIFTNYKKSCGLFNMYKKHRLALFQEAVTMFYLHIREGASLCQSKSKLEPKLHLTPKQVQKLRSKSRPNSPPNWNKAILSNTKTKPKPSKAVSLLYWKRKHSFAPNQIIADYRFLHLCGRTTTTTFQPDAAYDLQTWPDLI